jgi:hypothetical protein
MEVVTWVDLIACAMLFMTCVYLYIDLRGQRRAFVGVVGVIATIATMTTGCSANCTPGDASLCGLFCPQNCPAGGQTQTCPVLVNVTGTVTVWECNIPPQYCNGAPGQNDGPLVGCSCVICQTSEQAALGDAQQILAMQSLSVDPSGPPLQCRGPLATLNTAYDTGPLFTVAECTQVTQATCRPCDDGQGGTLQSVGQYCNTGEGMAPVPGGYVCCAGLTCTSTDTLAGTCQGTLQPCAPKAPALVPLTTTRLREIAALNNIGAGQTGIQLSRTIGLTFETWVLVTLGQNNPRNTKSFLSMERQNKTGGLPGSVIPEFVGKLNDWFPAQGWSSLPQGMFFEVKAVTGVLTQKTNNWQILGLVDVASFYPAAKFSQPQFPPPALVFTTTGNTNIGLDVLQVATSVGVAIWQQLVMEDTNTNPNNPDLYIDQALPANQAVYGAAVPLPMHPVWPHSPLVPLTSPPMPVPNDPDPPEVQ